MNESSPILAKVNVNLGERSYPIQIGADCLTPLATAMSGAVKPGRGVIVTNPHIGGLWGAPVQAALEGAGFELDVCEIPEGEENKNLDAVSSILDFMIQHKHTRQSLIFALGGGVIGDIAGFAASCLLRGIPFVQMPTTLLAMVDSSVGGKTGVNHPRGKNLIGAFWQPVFVGADLAFLETLENEDLCSGMAEVIKYGVIWDAELFEYLEANMERALERDPAVMAHLVRRSCEIKAEVVAQDEREGGLRAILNYGHTFGHAVEALEHFGIRHGEGVGMGMVAAARLAALRGAVPMEMAGRIAALTARAKLPTAMPKYDFEPYREAMASDKKSQRGKLRFVLPTHIGKVEIIDDVTEEQLRECIEISTGE